MSDQVQAEQLVKRMGMTGEHGIEATEGMNLPKNSSLDDALGDVIPGFSSLFSKHRRIVLVTDQHVYLFAGTIKRPGDRLGAFKLGPNVLRLESDGLNFPDGQGVRVTRYQAQKLLQAVGGSFSKEFARKVLGNAGNPNESVVTFAWGTNALATKRGAVDRASGALFIGGTDKMEHEVRFVLVTDRSCYVARDGTPDVAGTVVGSYALGVELRVSNGATVTFPDGQAVRLKNDTQASQLARAVGIR